MSDGVYIKFSADAGEVVAAAKMSGAVIYELGDQAKSAGAVASASFQDIARSLTAVKPAAAEAAAGLHGLTAASGSNRMALMEVEHSVRAVADGMIAGLSPTRVLAMEVPRLMQAYTELSPAAQASITAIAPMVGVATAVGSALAYVAYEAWESSRALAQLNGTTAALGRVSEVTSGVTQKMTEDLARDYNISIAAAAKLVETVNRLPEATLTTRDALKDLAPAMAAASGEDPQAVAEKLAKGFGSVSSLESFARENRLLDDGMRDSLKTAKENNDVFAAQDAVLAGLTHRYGAYQVQVKDFAQKSSLKGTMETVGMEAAGQNVADLAPTKPKDAALVEGPSDADQKAADAAMANHFAKWKEEEEAQLTASVKFGKDALGLELAFWTAKTALATKGSADRRQVDAEIYQIESQLHAQTAALDKKDGQEKKQQLAEWWRDYSEGMRQQIAAAQGNADEQTRLVGLWVHTGELLYGEDVSKFREASDEKTRLARAAAAEQRRLDTEWAQAQSQLAQQSLQSQIDSVDEDVDQTKISADQKFAVLKSLYDKIHDLRRKDLEDAMVAAGTDKAEALKYYNDIVALDQQHDNALANLDKQRAAKEAQTNQEIAQQAASTLMQMLSGKESFTQAAIRLTDQELEKVLANEIRKGLSWAETQLGMTASTAAGSATRTAAEGAENAGFLSRIFTRLAQWLGLETEQTASTVAGSAARTTAQATADAAAPAAAALSAAAQINAAAGVAGANAFAATAAIPFVGPELAPAAAAAAIAAVESFQSFAVASARGGMDRVPYDDMLTSLHKDEMVLSAPYANVVRRLGDMGMPSWGMPSLPDRGGGGLGGGGAGAFSPSISNTLNMRGGGAGGISHTEFRRMLSQHAGHIADEMRNLHRNSARKSL